MIDEVRLIHTLYSEERFDEALDKLIELGEMIELSPYLLVLKGKHILLSDKGPYELADARKAFEAALDIQEDCVEALLELGWFHYAVEDNAAEAKPFFEKALAVSKGQTTEIVEGFAKCLCEIAGKDKALEFIGDILAKSPLDEEKIAEVKEEIESGLVAEPEDGTNGNAEV